MDQELRQLDLATAETRRLATVALAALGAPRPNLRDAAADYIESVAKRRLDASRHASVEAMAKLSDDDLADLRFWTEEQVARCRSEVEAQIESCDFWIAEASGMSPSDVSMYGGALMPKPKDSNTGIPHALVLLFERSLTPLRRGLAAIGFAGIPAAAEPRVEVALARAWRAYREAAIECVARWADVDERYHASAERFQEMRWELAGEADVEALKARRAADQADSSAGPEALSTAAIAADAAESESDEPLPDLDRPPCEKAIVRADSETLIPLAN